MQREDLDPWRVILHHLFEVDSREIPRILDRAGLAVDWTLNEREDYSAKTRLAAFRPRIVTAYDALNDDSCLRVAYIVAQVLTGDAAEALDRDLRNIGWNIESGRLVPNSVDVSELFFGTGTQHDAYVEIRRILHQAKNSIALVDPYVDGSIFTLLSSEGQAVKSIRLLTHRCPDDFGLETTKFHAQYPQSEIEVRKTKEFHDRFVVVDGDSCWHIGASIKDAGVKAFMINQVEDQRNREALLVQFEESWSSASPIGTGEQPASGAKPGSGGLYKHFDALRRKVLYCSVTNEIPPALRNLRALLIESGLVERPAFRKFFEDWLASPFVVTGAPVSNLLTSEQIKQMTVDLRGLSV